MSTPEQDLAAFEAAKNARLLRQAERLEQSSAEKGDFFSDMTAGLTAIPTSMFSGDVEMRRQVIRDNPELDDYEKAKQLKELSAQKEVPDTSGGAVGRGAAESAIASVALGLIAKRVPAIDGAGRVRSAIQNTMNKYGELFTAKPIATTTTEGLLGGVAGLGGFKLAEAYPNLPAAQFIGEVAAGSAASLAPTVFKKFTPTGIIINKAKDFFSLEGTTSRAAARMQQLTDPKEALAALKRGEDLSPGAALTTAQRTGQEGLIELENTIIKASKDGTLSQQYADMLEQTDAAIRNDLNFGGSSTEDISKFYEHQIDHYSALVEARLNIARAKAEEAVKKSTDVLRPKEYKEAIELSVRDEIEKAYREARGLEDALFEAVDPAVKVDVAVSKSARENWIARLSEATSTNMPSAAQFLNPKSKKYIGRVRKNKDGSKTTLGQTNVKELRGVQSALRTEARAARSGETPNRQKAMIAEELADSITEDLSRIYMNTEGDNPVALAVSFSRELNQRFTQGPVGRILGKTGTGASRIDPERALSETLGTSKNLSSYDSILSAVGENPEVQASMEDFIKHRFFSGEDFNASRANSFINANQDLMSRMPFLRNEVKEAIATGNAAKLKAPRKSKFLNRNVNKAIVFIEQGAEDAFKKVYSSNTTGKDMQQLIRMVDRDVTGEAKQGLRSAFTTWMLDSSSSNKAINGESLSDLFNKRKTQIMINQLFDKSDKARLERAVRTGKLLDTARNKETLDSITTNGIGGLWMFLARVTGASAGRQVTNTLQGSAIFSENFKKLAQAGIDNPAQQMLTDAINNEELFKALLDVKLIGGKNPRVPLKSQRAINAWMGVTLKNLAMEDQTQPSQEQED